MPYKACSFSVFLSNSWDNSTGELHEWDSDMKSLDKDERFHLGNVYFLFLHWNGLSELLLPGRPDGK